MVPVVLEECWDAAALLKMTGTELGSAPGNCICTSVNDRCNKCNNWHTVLARGLLHTKCLVFRGKILTQTAQPQLLNKMVSLTLYHVILAPESRIRRLTSSPSNQNVVNWLYINVRC